LKKYTPTKKIHMTGIDTKDEMEIVHAHPSLTHGERKLLEWQFHCSGHFYRALWEAICHADEENLSLLEKGFPSEVQAYRDFAHTGDFGRKAKQILEKQAE
jgi:hypothetical protein